jgi:hypothetical protein
VHLNVLARGEVEEVVPEMRVGDRAIREVYRYLADNLRLLRAENTSGHLYADHKRVTALILRVDADPLEALDLARHLI